MQLMNLMLLGVRGLAKVADGMAGAALRLGREGALLVGSAQGALQEAALSGRLFYASTAPTGVDPGTAIDTAAPFALANPNGSRVLLVVRKVAVGYVSGTLGAGFVAGCIGPSSQTAVTGTAVIPTAAYGGSGTGSAGKAFTTATLPATPNVAMPLVNLGAKAAATALDPAVALFDVEGGIVIEPGGSFSLQAVCAAGTSPLTVLGCAWEEIPV